MTTRGWSNRRSKKLVPEPVFAEGHEHTSECDALYEEWKRYHIAVIDEAGRFRRDQRLLARQLVALGCSGEARRRVERDAEIAEHGHSKLT